MTEMTTKETLEAEKGIDFAHLVALFDKALDGFDKIRERQEETAEQMRKTDEQMRKTDEQMRKTDERIERMAIEIGGLGNSIGQTDEQMRKTDEQMRKTDEQMRKTDEQMRKTDEQMRKTDEQMRKTDERIERMAIEIGGLGNSIGLFMEALFSANLWDKFDAEGYEFEQGGKRIFRYKGKVIAEVDFFLENGKYVMAVEVKTSLTEHYVNEHLKKLEKIRTYFDNINDKRILLGAVAGPSVSNDVIRYAQRNGLYVIVQSGNAAKIADKIEGFSARKW